MRGRIDIRRKIIARDGAFLDLAEQIHHQDIAVLQLVQHALMRGAGTRALGFGLGFLDIEEVLAEGHELHGHRPSHQFLLRMQNPPVAFVLVRKPAFLLAQHGPHLFGGKALALFQDGVGHLGPAVLKALERVLRRILEHLLFGKREDLRVERGQQQKVPPAAAIGNTSCAAMYHFSVRAATPGKFDPGKEFERCAASGGDVRDLAGHAGRLDRLLGIAAAHHGSGARIRHGFGQRHRTLVERRLLEDAHGTVPDDRLRARDHLCVGVDGLRPDIHRDLAFGNGFDHFVRGAFLDLRDYDVIERQHQLLDRASSSVRAQGRAYRTMIVVMAAGLSANLTANPLQAVTTVTVQIATLLVGDQEFDSPKTLAAFALGLLLFFVTLALNLVALHVVRRYRERYD